MRLPKCTGYTEFTDCGNEYDCEAQHDRSCEDCLSLYKLYGGLWNPDTGKKINPIIAFILYGSKKHKTQNTKHKGE